MAVLGQDLTDAQIDVLRQQAALTNTDRLLRIMEILGETQERMRYALSRRTLLETALIRCARTAVVVSLEEVLRRINELRGVAGSPSTETAPAAPASPRAAAPEAGAIAESAGRYAAGARSSERASGPAPGTDELSLLRERWGEIAGKAGKIVVMARNTLADAIPVAATADKVVVAFDPEFASEASGPASARIRRALETVLNAVLGRKVAVEFQTEGAPPEASPVDEEGAPRGDGGTEEPAVPGAAPRIAAGPAGGKSAGMKQRDWSKDPAVESALKVFGGKILDVRE